MLASWRSRLRRWFSHPEHARRLQQPDLGQLRRLGVEQLEDRVMPAITPFEPATLLTLTNNRATGHAFVSTPSDVELFQVSLNQGDRAAVSVAAQSIGSGL